MVVELKFGLKTIDLPYTVRVPNVTEEMFDDLVDEDTRAELIDGVMIVHSPTSTLHDDITGWLRPLMRVYAEDTKQGRVLGGESLVHLASCRRFCPDIYFIEAHQVSQLSRKQFEGTPSMVVEVLSPSNRSEDLEDKRPAYQAAGVRELWFVDPDAEEIIIDRRRKKNYVTTHVSKGKLFSTVLTGFWIDTAWLWAHPLPSLSDCLRKISK